MNPTEISTSPIVLVTLFSSSLIVLSSNSWLLLWVCLEINTLAFCSILSSIEPTNTNNTAEAAINYFIIQSTASAIMIIYLASPSQVSGSELLFLSGTTAILMNLAAAPFHGWFLEIVPNLSITSNTVLITWQKLAPIFILTYTLNSAVAFSILLSGLLGSITQIHNTSLLEVLALSSVFNLSWIMLAALTSTQNLFLFIVLYWSILLPTLHTLKNSNTTNSSSSVTNTTNPWSIMILIAGLAGIPPSLGFFANIQVALSALKSSLNTITTYLIVLSAINFFVYLRITTSTILIAPPQRQNNNENSENIMGPILALNLLPILALAI